MYVCRLADEIRTAMGPTANGDHVFNHARRVVSAEMQSIVYGQFLPILLGNATMEDWGLTLKSPSQYDEKLQPGIFNAFATAG